MSEQLASWLEQAAQSGVLKEVWVHILVQVVLVGVGGFLGYKAHGPMKKILSFPFRFTKGLLTKDVRLELEEALKKLEAMARVNKSIYREHKNAVERIDRIEVRAAIDSVKAKEDAEKKGINDSISVEWSEGSGQVRFGK